MNEFQVGDRVSVEGVIEKVGSGDYHIRLNSPAKGAKAWFYASAMTLVERPKRKLRVGSVWEHNGTDTRYYAIGDGWFGYNGTNELGQCRGFIHRETLDFDTHPQDWREVPVEELEREATYRMAVKAGVDAVHLSVITRCPNCSCPIVLVPDRNGSEIDDWLDQIAPHLFVEMTCTHDFDGGVCNVCWENMQRVCRLLKRELSHAPHRIG